MRTSSAARLRRTQPVWLMAVLMCTLAACGSGSSGQPDKPGKVEEQLTEIAAKAESPVYYRGPAVP